MLMRNEKVSSETTKFHEIFSNVLCDFRREVILVKTFFPAVSQPILFHPTTNTFSNAAAGRFVIYVIGFLSLTALSIGVRFRRACLIHVIIMTRNSRLMTNFVGCE